MPEHEQLPDRIQRDLEEALRHGGVDKLPKRPRPKRRPIRLGIPDLRPKGPGELILIAAVLVVAGIVVPPLRSYLLTAGFLCGIVAVATHLIQPHGRVRKYWRGRYLDIPTGRWQERLYRLIYRQP